MSFVSCNFGLKSYVLSSIAIIYHFISYTRRQNKLYKQSKSKLICINVKGLELGETDWLDMGHLNNLKPGTLVAKFIKFPFLLITHLNQTRAHAIIVQCYGAV